MASELIELMDAFGENVRVGFLGVRNGKVEHV